jgi:hypothetical protein
MATNNSINISASGVIGYDGAGTMNSSSVTTHSLLIGGANNHTINSLGVATNGQLPMGSTGADPVLATISAGTGISISNGAGSITISGTGGGLTWTVVTGAAQAMAINSGYIANNAGTCVMTLPATAAVGSVFGVSGMNNATGWQVAQNAGQQIFFGSASTTSGTGGSLASTKTFDSLYLVCNVANTSFIVLNSVGNITVV